MEPWKEVCIYMCVYAFIREFRPIDPFFIKYLTLLSEKYTVELIKEEVYPVGSYANVFFVVIIFLVTDYLRYKPIIILNGLSGVISYGLLLGSPSIMALKTGQVFQMLFRAAEVAYVSYTFAKIKNKDQYQIASSLVRTSVMVGKFSCGMLSQVLISWNLVSYIHLLYLSIFGTILTTIWSLIIPSVKCSMYFYKEKESVVNTIVVHSQEIVNTVVIKEDLNKNRIKDDYIKMKFGEVLQKLWTDFKVAYADANVFKWSAWYSLSLCGYVLVAQYIQLQWQEIASHKKNTLLMNGAVESTATLFSAVTAYIIGVIQIDWGKHGELIMATVALGLGIILSFLAYTEYLAISYVCYVFFCCTYQTMLTLSSAEVAKFLQRDCYALVFGFNKFIASIFITVFTLFVVEDTFFSFNIREQFLIYGMYFVCLGFIFLLLAFMSLKRLQKNDTLS